MAEKINHPSHYNRGNIECIDYIIDQKCDFLTGNVIKYVSRAGYKDTELEIEDLNKAMWYLKKKISLLENTSEQKKENRRIVYISHPYSGNDGNKEKVANIIRGLQKEFPKDIFISPIHAFGFLYKEVDYDIGLEMCLALMEICTEVRVFGNYWESVGCMAEIKRAKELGIDTYIYKTKLEV